MSIEVANESGIMVDEPGLAALARYVLDAMGMHPLAELSVLLVDTGTMADLHQRSVLASKAEQFVGLGNCRGDRLLDQE